MMASASENPRRAARITDCGLPPTPIQAGNGPDSVCGTTSWLQQRRAGLALPGDRPALEQFGEQRGLLVEEFLVVGEVVAEQRERFDARPAAEDDLGPAAGDRVQRGVPLEHPDRVVGAQHGDRGAEPDPVRAGRDRGRGPRPRPASGSTRCDARRSRRSPLRPVRRRRPPRPRCGSSGRATAACRRRRCSGRRRCRARRCRSCQAPRVRLHGPLELRRRQYRPRTPARLAATARPARRLPSRTGS